MSYDLNAAQTASGLVQVHQGLAKLDDIETRERALTQVTKPVG